MKCFYKHFCYLNLKYVFTSVTKLGTDMRYCSTTAYFLLLRELTTFSQISKMAEMRRFQKSYFAEIENQKNFP